MVTKRIGRLIALLLREIVNYLIVSGSVLSGTVSNRITPHQYVAYPFY